MVCVAKKLFLSDPIQQVKYKQRLGNTYDKYKDRADYTAYYQSFGSFRSVRFPEDSPENSRNSKNETKYTKEKRHGIIFEFCRSESVAAIQASGISVLHIFSAVVADCHNKPSFFFIITPAIYFVNEKLKPLMLLHQRLSIIV